MAQPAKKHRTTGKSSKQSASERHKLELLIGTLAALAVAAMLSLLVYEALTGQTDTPSFRFAVERIERMADGYHVSIRVMNTGDRVASAVEVEATLMRDGDVVETAQMTIDYIPSHSERGGGLVFRNDPADADLRIGVKGYADP